METGYERSCWIRCPNNFVNYLYICILLHCQPLHPEELWENFKVAMSEDYDRYFGLLQNQKKAYAQINALLCAKGLSDFPQMEQLIEYDEEDNYTTLEKAMKVGTQIPNNMNN